MAPRATIRPVLLEYFMNRPGEVVHINTIMSELELSRAQVQGGMRSLLDKGLVNTVLMGNAWEYRVPNKEPGAPLSAYHFEGDPMPGETVKAVANGEMVKVVDPAEPGDLMEIVKCLNDGRILLQDNQGDLFVATRLGVS